MRWLDMATSRRTYPWLVVLLVLGAIVLRLPDAATSTSILDGHKDAATYYNLANVASNEEDQARPLPHAASGWPLFLGHLYRLFGIGPGPGVQHVDDIPPRGQRLLAGLDGLERQEEFLRHHPEDTARGFRLAYAAGAVLGGGVAAAAMLLARRLGSPATGLLVGVLVAVEPALVRSAGDAMAEPLFTLLVLLAFAAVLAARRHPAWLVAASALAAGAFMVRLNGLVFALVLAGYALLVHLPRPAPRRRTLAWLGAGLVVAVLLATPYLAWRAAYLPGPLHMGQNGDLWADAFWEEGSYSDPTSPNFERYRTFSDYTAAHTLTDATERLWRSVWWQARDFALEASVALLALAALFAWAYARGRVDRRAAALVPLAAAATFLPLVWIYPLVATGRYYQPLLPFLAVGGALALAAWAREDPARRGRWVVGGAGAAAAFAALPLVPQLPRALAWTFSHAEVAWLVLLGGALFALLAALGARGEDVVRVTRHVSGVEARKRSRPPSRAP